MYTFDRRWAHDSSCTKCMTFSIRSLDNIRNFISSKRQWHHHGWRDGFHNRWVTLHSVYVHTNMFDTSALWLMFFDLMLLEPIVMEGSTEFKILKDKWTAVSVDDKRYPWLQLYILFPIENSKYINCLNRLFQNEGCSCNSWKDINLYLSL